MGEHVENDPNKETEVPEGATGEADVAESVSAEPAEGVQLVDADPLTVAQDEIQALEAR